MVIRYIQLPFYYDKNVRSYGTSTMLVNDHFKLCGRLGIKSSNRNLIEYR